MERYGKRFKDMSKIEKVKHIWEYYRYHILAVIIAICVVGALGKTILFPEPPNDVDIMLAGQMYIDDTQYNEVCNEYKEQYKTGLNLNNINWEGDAQLVAMMYQKIPLLMTTKELDVMAISTDTYENFVSNYGADMFQPLEEVPELKELLEKHKDKLFVYDKIKDKDGNLVDAPKHVYGIKVEKFSHIPCLQANEEMIVGLNPAAKDFEKSINMLKYILE